jgi:hypothetical protein
LLARSRTGLGGRDGASGAGALAMGYFFPSCSSA